MRKALGAPSKSADAFARILLEDESQSTEQLLSLRSIGPLQADSLAVVSAGDEMGTKSADEKGGLLAASSFGGDMDASNIDDGPNEPPNPRR